MSTGVGVRRLRGLLIATLLLGTVIGGVGVYAALPTQDGTWTGDWIRELYGWFTELRVTGLTANRVVITNGTSYLKTDPDIAFSGDTLTVTKLGATTLSGDISASGNDLTGAGWVNGTSTTFTNAYVTTYYLGTTNINARLGGDWGGLDLTNVDDLNTTDTFIAGDLWIHNGTAYENATDTLIYPESEADIIVWGEPAAAPTMYYAKNGHTGQVTNNTDATTLIQNVINSLTTGRTWEESIILKGDFGDVYNITLVSNLKLIGVNAKMNLPNGETAIFSIPHLTEVENITISGINFTSTTHGNYALYLFYFDGAAWRRPQYVTVTNCNFDNFYSGITGILDQLEVTRCRATNTDLWLNLPAGYNISISDNNIVVPINNSSMLLLDVNRVSLYGNHFKGSYNPTGTDVAIKIETSYNIAITGNTFEGFGLGGINIDYYNRVAVPSFGITITGNTFTYCGYGSGGADGMVSAGWGNLACNNIVIIGNTGYECHNLIDISSTAAVQVTAIANSLDNAFRGFRAVGANYDLTLQNNVFIGGLGGTPTLRTGILRASNNYGYTTESSGTATVLNATTSIAFAHSLSATPIASWFSITFTENPTNPTGNWWLTCNATHAVLNVAADPGASNLDFSWQARRP